MVLKKRDTFAPLRYPISPFQPPPRPPPPSLLLLPPPLPSLKIYSECNSVCGPSILLYSIRLNSNYLQSSEHFLSVIKIGQLHVAWTWIAQSWCDICYFNPPTFGTFCIQVDAPFETIRYCGFEWWNNCVQCWFPKWFWMVGQLIQNLVWIFPNGSTANTKPCLDTSKWWINGPSKTIWMDLNGSTACYQHCSNGITVCVQNQWAFLKVENLNGFKWSISRRVKRVCSTCIKGQLKWSNL